MPGLYDSLVNLGTAVFDSTKGFARYRAANVAMAKALADNYGGVNQLNRGLDEYIGQQENLLDSYSKQMNATLVLEKRNKALQESFGINSVAAAQLSQTLMKMQEVVGGTQEQVNMLEILKKCYHYIRNLINKMMANIDQCFEFNML